MSFKPLPINTAPVRMPLETMRKQGSDAVLMEALPNSMIVSSVDQLYGRERGVKKEKFFEEGI